MPKFQSALQADWQVLAGRANVACTTQQAAADALLAPAENISLQLYKPGGLWNDCLYEQCSTKWDRLRPRMSGAGTALFLQSSRTRCGQSSRTQCGRQQPAGMSGIHDPPLRAHFRIPPRTWGKQPALGRPPGRPAGTAALPSPRTATAGGRGCPPLPQTPPPP